MATSSNMTLAEIHQLRARTAEFRGVDEVIIRNIGTIPHEYWKRHENLARRLVSTLDHGHHLEHIRDRIDQGERRLAAFVTACEDFEASLLARHLYFWLRAEQEKHYAQMYQHQEDFLLYGPEFAEWLNGRKRFKDVLEARFGGSSESDLGSGMVEAFRGDCVLGVVIPANQSVSRVCKLVAEAWAEFEAIHDLVAGELRLFVIFAYVANTGHSRLWSWLPCGIKLLRTAAIPRPLRWIATEHKLINRFRQSHPHCIWASRCEPLKRRHFSEWPPQWLRHLSGGWPVDIVGTDDHASVLRSAWRQFRRPRLDREDLVQHLAEHFDKSRIIPDWESDAGSTPS